METIKARLLIIPYTPEKLELGMYYMADLDAGMRGVINEKNRTLCILSEEDMKLRGLTHTARVEYVKLYLVSNEFPKIGDLFAERLATKSEYPNSPDYHNLPDKEIYDIFQMDNLNDPQRDDCRKVIALPEQIGITEFDNGAMNWLGEMPLKQLQLILNNNGECEIKAHQNKPDLRTSNKIQFILKTKLKS